MPVTARRSYKLLVIPHVTSIMQEWSAQLVNAKGNRDQLDACHPNMSESVEVHVPTLVCKGQSLQVDRLLSFHISKNI